METTEKTTLPGKNLIARENLRSFYSQQLPDILKTVFLNPIDGTRDLFNNNRTAYKNILLMILTVMGLYFIAPYVLIGKELRAVVGFSVLIKASIAAGMFMVIISAISFGIKSIGGKPVFKNELLTGGLCGVGLVMLLTVLALIRIFADSISMYDLMNPLALVSNLKYLIIFILYIFLFMVNVFQQSLKSAGSSDAASWYLSPLSVMLAFYLTIKIAGQLL